MSHTWTAYLEHERVRELIPDQPLHTLWGGWNRSTRYLHTKLTPGDALVFVTVHHGLIYLIGRMIVSRMWTSDEWEASDVLKRRKTPAGSCVLIGEFGTVPHFSRAFPKERVVGEWRYLSARGKLRPLAQIREDRLHRVETVAGTYRLSPQTAATVHGFIDGSSHEPPTEEPQASLIRLLMRRPDDRDTAHVLADAWQDAADPRAELMRAELALMAKVRGAVGSYKRLIAQRAETWEGLPGGFPYSISWGPKLRW